MTGDSFKKALPARFRRADGLVQASPFFALWLLGLSLFIHKIIDTDIWWHLRTGKYILETLSIPVADMYSYTAAGNSWIDTHWLFQVVLYGTYNALGAYGLSLLFLLVYSSVFIILWKACSPEKDDFAAIFLFWLGLLACSSRFLARPEAFTYLMISIYTFLLCRFERGRAGKWSLLMLIPLQALWVNMQGLFILGLFLISAYAAQPVAVTVIRKALKKEADPAQTRKGILLIAVLAGSTAACLLNPYGLEGLWFPFSLFTRAGGMENIFARSIAELQPPFSGYNLTLPLKFFGAFLALSAVVLALDYRKMKLSHILVFAGLGYLAMSARRNVAIFVLAFLPIAVEHASSVVARLREMRGGKHADAIRRADLVCRLIIFLAVVSQIYSVMSGRYYMADRRSERFGFGFKEQTFPHGAFVFVKEKDISGPFFNNMDIGGMFIWEMYPEERVFIDARLEVNSAEVFSEYRRAMSDAKAFVRLSKKYALNAILITHTSQDGLRLMPVLSLLPDWTLVYLDPIAAVFVRTVPENDDVISEHRIDLANAPIPTFAPNDDLNESGPRVFSWIFGRPALAAKDTEAQNRFSLGLVFLVMGRHGRAVEQFKAGLELAPSSPEGHYNLGLAYDQTGRKESAVQYYEKAIELNHRHARAHGNLGSIYEQRGLKKMAEKEYKQAIKWGNNPIPLYNLGALYYERGDSEAARAQWRRALKVDPSFAPASEALESLD